MTITPAIERGSILALRPKEEMKPEDRKAKEVYEKTSCWFLSLSATVPLTIGMIASIGCGLAVAPAIAVSLFGFCCAALYGMHRCSEHGLFWSK